MAGMTLEETAPETETKQTVWGIWHMENGVATLCESDESMTVYYDCAFFNQANATKYAEKLNSEWVANAARFGWFGKSEYFAAPLPEGCVAEWIDGETEELKSLEETATTEPPKAYVSVQNFGDTEQKKGLCETINNLTMFHAYVDSQGNVVIPCKLSEIGDLLSSLASHDATDWVEYSVQFGS